MAKRKRRGGLLVGLRELRGGGQVLEAGDDEGRLYLDTDALVGERATVRDLRVGIAMSDETAHQVVLRLVANMRPRWRNKTVRVLDRGGFGPPVQWARPSNG